MLAPASVVSQEMQFWLVSVVITHAQLHAKRDQIPSLPMIVKQEEAPLQLQQVQSQQQQQISSTPTINYFHDPTQQQQVQYHYSSQQQQAATNNYVAPQQTTTATTMATPPDAPKLLLGKVSNLVMKMCIRCKHPIYSFGILRPCGHYYCYDCAHLMHYYCYQCRERTERIKGPFILGSEDYEYYILKRT